MKKITDKIKSNKVQLIEIIIWASAALGSIIIDLPKLFEEYLNNNFLTPDNFFSYLIVLIISKGKIFTWIMVVLLILKFIRSYNKKSELIMNESNIYHSYSYGWYWFCSKILGIKQCNLVLVPIYMQFKLIIRKTFKEFPLNENEYPIIDNETINIKKSNTSESQNKVNLILEDTYSIDDKQIPPLKQNLFTIKISRNNGKSYGRHFNEKFIEETINVVRGLQSVSEMNIYATTNPLNTKHIAQRVFALADRGNIEHLYVFQQDNSGARVFRNGYKIY